MNKKNQIPAQQPKASANAVSSRPRMAMAWGNLMAEIFVRKPSRIGRATSRWSSKLIFEIAASPLSQISLFIGLAGVVSFADDIWAYTKNHVLNIALAVLLPSIFFIIGWSIRDLIIRHRKMHFIATEETSRKFKMAHFLRSVEKQGANVTLTQRELRAIVGMEDDGEMFHSLLDEARYMNLLGDNRGIYFVPDMFGLQKHLEKISDDRTK